MNKAYTKFDNFIFWLGFIGLTLLYLSQSMMLAINTTSSLPQHVFLVIKHQALKQHDYIAFYPPPNPFYSCHLLFIKQVAGIAGDKVSVSQRRFYINGKGIGAAKAYSSRGVPLTLGKTGQLKHGEYFVATTHPDGFDSRYAELGWINKRQVVGRAFPLF